MHWAFIYFAPGTDPQRDRVVVERSGFKTVLVPVPEETMIVEVAKELVSQGAALIELCGVFGPVWTAKVIDAVGSRIPVGGVAFGSESAAGLARVIESGA